MARADNYTSEQWCYMARRSGYNARLLSRQLKFSRRQLERSTRKLFYKSPQDWLNELRLIEAAKMLQKHRLVKWVAIELGFKQVSHFSLKFKLHYGLSPRHYLERMDHEALAADLNFPGSPEKLGEKSPASLQKINVKSLSNNNVAPG
jgi:AraC-like DNA-binding protein